MRKSQRGTRRFQFSGTGVVGLLLCCGVTWAEPAPASPEAGKTESSLLERSGSKRIGNTAATAVMPAVEPEPDAGAQVLDNTQVETLARLDIALRDEAHHQTLLAAKKAKEDQERSVAIAVSSVDQGRGNIGGPADTKPAPGQNGSLAPRDAKPTSNKIKKKSYSDVAPIVIPGLGGAIPGSK